MYRVGTYSGGRVIAIFGGVPLVGIAEDSGITIEQVGDGATTMNGLDGSVARAVPVDFRFRVTVRLQDVSPTNDILTDFYKADQISLLGVLPLLVQDLSGRTIFSATSAWVTKLPNVDLKKENAEREWIIEGVADSRYVGGNV